MRVLYNKAVESAIPFGGLVPNKLSLMFSDSNSPEKEGKRPAGFVRSGRALSVAVALKRKGALMGRLSF